MRRSAAPSLKDVGTKKQKLNNSPASIAKKFGISLSSSFSSQDSSTTSQTDSTRISDNETDSSQDISESPVLAAKISPKHSIENNKIVSEGTTEKTLSTHSFKHISKFKPPTKSSSSGSMNQNPEPNSTTNDLATCMKETLTSNAVNICKQKRKFLPPSQTASAIVGERKDETSTSNVEECYYSVVWCKASNKKHKKWDGDGVLITRGKSATLKDEEGKIISKGSGYKTADLIALSDGNTLIVGGKEIEVQGVINRESYLSGQCFLKASQTTSNVLPSSTSKTSFISRPFVPHLSGNNREIKKSSAVITPRHDPNHPNAFVMPRPSKEMGKDKQIIDVVVDPFISHHLRPHQREGVKFLYNGVMGFNDTNGNGVILADEMGLGKTLQCIALIWTLLKQGPFSGKAVIKKCVVVTPGSLVKNWCKEFSKWLGSERLIPFGIDQKKRVDEYLLNMHSPVMVISYEMFLRCIEDIRKAKFDLIICDEAHRLKNSAIKTASAISSLFIAKRVLLTGTPIQNNLQEFYTLAEMANPGVLGTLNAFRKVFIEPITQSQQPRCDTEIKELGEIRAKELTRLTSTFCLRRTADINKDYLPSKVEHVIFARMSKLQVSLYEHLLSTNSVRSCFTYADGLGSKHLICIGALKKLCNDPKLIYQMATQEKENYADDESIYSNILPVFPDDYPNTDCETLSGKLSVLQSLLQNFKEEKQKVVLVSNSTKMLDILEEFCDSYSYTKVRLDGQTNVATRQQIVDRFNDRHSNVFVFLLSSKAGGVGLNLTGASNLILYDIDWNPANDLQAMARVWRDGQKHEVNIYRLLITGSIEEKIYQRQIIKQGLSGAVVDSLSSKDTTEFSAKDLKDLLSYKSTNTCLTHELLQCYCHLQDAENTMGGKNCSSSSSTTAKKNVSMAQLLKWEHIKDFREDANLVKLPLPSFTALSIHLADYERKKNLLLYQAN